MKYGAQLQYTVNSVNTVNFSFVAHRLKEIGNRGTWDCDPSDAEKVPIIKKNWLVRVGLLFIQPLDNNKARKHINH